MTAASIRIGKVTWKAPAAGTIGRARADSSGAAYDYSRKNTLSALSGAFAYDADSTNTQELGAWNPLIRSPDTESNWYRDRRVARNRDLVRNDGWAVGGVTSVLDTTIGSLFRLKVKPNYRVLSRLDKRLDKVWASEFGNVAESEWTLYADDPSHWCDVTRTLSMVQNFRLMLAHKIIDGENLGCLKFDPDSIGPGAARYATRLQVLDPDRLSNPFEAPDTHDRRGGVHIDNDGAPIGYFIRRAHQNDIFDSMESMIWDYAPRETAWGRPVIVHDYDHQRAATHRGVGLLTPVLSTMKMLNNYDRAEMQQALLQTVLGTFITSPYDPEQLRMAMDAPADGDLELNAYQNERARWHSERGTNLAGVRIPSLVPGESITSLPSRHPSNNFEVFEYAALRKAAAALGTTAEQFTRDFSKANYSSLRASLLDAWKTMKRRRDDFGTGTASPIACAFIEELVDREPDLLPRGAPDFLDMRAAYTAHYWIGPGRGWVDPLKERQGAILGLDGGLGTLEDECNNIAGADWLEQVEQRAIEVAKFKELGLTLPEWAGVDGNAVPAHDDERKPLVE